MNTTQEYWDCECEVLYINKKSERVFCPYCGAYENECPDSMIEEVLDGKNLRDKS